MMGFSVLLLFIMPKMMANMGEPFMRLNSGSVKKKKRINAYTSLLLN